MSQFFSLKNTNTQKQSHERKPNPLKAPPHTLDLSLSPSAFTPFHNSYKKNHKQERNNTSLFQNSLNLIREVKSLQDSSDPQNKSPLPMDEFWRGHIPAFGSWDCNDEYGLPFTQCFESARQAGLVRYTYAEDRDLYVAGDLYENDVVTTPAMIVVPRRRAKARYPHVKEEKKEEWVVKEPPSSASLKPPPQKAPKAVDEDLYKISPELLYAKPKRKRRLGFLSSCLFPTCAS